MRLSPWSPAGRLVVGTIALSAAAAVAGGLWEVTRFGTNAAAAASRVEAEVRARVDERTADVEALAERVAGEGALIAEAAANRDHLPALFDRLMRLAEPVDQHGVAATVYVPVYVPGLVSDTYRVLAWSNGPGEKDLTPARLAGPAALFVAPGHAGTRLLAMRPVEVANRRVAVVVAETVLAPASSGDVSHLAVDPSSTASPPRRLFTSFGPVQIVERYLSARDDSQVLNTFSIKTPTGATLLEVIVDPTDMANARRTFRRRVVTVALLPFPVLFGLLAPMALSRRRLRDPTRVWLAWTLAATMLMAAGAAGAAALAALAGAPGGVAACLSAAAALAGVAGLVGGWWWRAGRPHRHGRAPVRFVFEQLAGGLALAVSVEALARLLQNAITPDVLDEWRFVLFPFDADRLLFLGQVLLAELAIAWAAGLTLATVAGRWTIAGRTSRFAGSGNPEGLRYDSTRTLRAIILWLIPVSVLVTIPSTAAHAMAAPAAVVVATAIVFALAAPRLRRSYHHATQSMRLILELVAVIVPLAAIYPMAAVSADRTIRALIEQQYAPLTARYPQELRAELTRSQQAIDRLATLPTLVAARRSFETQESYAAFLVWSQTSLVRSRVISDVELYGPNRALVSRFALNLPEYLYRASTQTWEGTSCAWEVYGENAPFGAESFRMLHAERGICDAAGRLLGGVVVHVASHDYQALPFVSSANPYSEVLGTPAATPAVPRLPDLQLVVYGWSLQPLFTSGGVAFPVTPELFDRLYRTGTTFWEALESEGRTYQVVFSQNRDGIYALGYPSPTFVEHAMRMAEILAAACVFFILLQGCAALAAPFTRRADVPLRLLFHEVRTSFYRKLFLFFVAAAVVPVVAFALVFGAYMTARFRTDVESEAKSVVTVARRVFDELASAELRPGNPLPANDDVMVWIRQVISQDVNLYKESELVATSRRDLFDSGLLPTRTPATVYRGIALNRLPSLVAEDQLGELRYLVAAAPVSPVGQDARILTVPLAPRQRELEREEDELNRGVLVGSVLVVLFAAALGASMASRIADPVARLTRATRQIAAGQLDVRITADTNDELRRLVDDFNTMTGTLVAQRAELARTNQLAAWHEMARQVAHEIKNPLTPIQLAAEHLRHVNADRGRPLGPVAEQCLDTVLGQVRLLRQIASEFSTFSGRPTPHFDWMDPGELVAKVVDPYRIGSARGITIDVDAPANLPRVWGDPNLVARALTNLVENALQAMPMGGQLRVALAASPDRVTIEVADTGVGMDETTLARAFEPYFSTKTAGSGLGLANARQHIEIGGGTIAIASAPGRGTTVTITLSRQIQQA